MKTALLFVSLLLPVAVMAQKTSKVIVDPKGAAQKETYYALQDNLEVKHGSYLKQRRTGSYLKPALAGFYKQGQRDSIWTEYDWRGKLSGTGSYRQDQKVRYLEVLLTRKYPYSAI